MRGVDGTNPACRFDPIAPEGRTLAA